MLRKHLKLAASLFYVCMMCSCAIYAEPNGFANISWNTDIKALKDSKFVLVSEREGLIYYKVIGVEQVFHKAKPSKVEYGFLNDKFTSVYLELSGRDNCHYMKEELIEKYGSPSGGFLNKILKWEGSETTVLYVERNSGMSCSVKIAYAAAVR